MKKLIATLVTVVLSAGPAGTVHGAEAEPTAPGATPAITDLTLTLEHPESTTTDKREVTLSCDPPGGGHPTPAKACQELSARKGQFTQEAPGRVCTMEYAPVIAEAKGRWKGKATSFKREYDNNCKLHAHTGAIFEF
ncbi:SSI family serine proteinase inhibitor [Streptomyces sp. SID3343]|uniref:SSI family serine proteinase inhibitor n=1 Tax=Streptomyces sp. SID3343 TaxID=2690260 RepID=UPI001369DCDC|nr:SSI family serine proteinase inhibitor [Streptomyces sp. SID3343]MYW01217.1 hypothetical protein [Streptomyces sp. SID3343]